jgi:beta-N-acetylhexosaminidase
LLPFRAAIAAGVQAVMSAHLRVPALDAELPATLSRKIMTELLRDELGFDGLIVTDGIEMRAISDRYGLANATVMALDAGADAICVGGEHADEETAIMLRDAIVAAVRSGELAEERLADAAARVARLAAWSVAAPKSAPDPRAAEIGLSAARRALRITAPDATFPLAGAAFVIEFQPQLSMAIAPETPWGVLAPLAEVAPATSGMRLASEAGLPEALEASLGRPLVLVVRDQHRYPWMADSLKASLTVRPDAVVVEMGVPADPRGDVRIATFGATAAAGRAVAELLAGR